MPYYVSMLSKILKMPKSKIRVIKPYVGGGFGCRTEALNVEMITAMLLTGQSYCTGSLAARIRSSRIAGVKNRPSRYGWA